MDTGRYDLELTHPDYETVRQSVEIAQGGRVEVAPELKPTQRHLNGLLLADLKAKRAKLARTRTTLGVLAAVAGGIGIAGAGVGGVGELLVQWNARSLASTYAAYSAATDPAVVADLGPCLEGYATIIGEWRLLARNVSLIVAGGELLAGSVLAILKPRLALLDREIRRLEEALK